MLAASRASSSAAVRRDSRHRLEASVDERDRRRTLCVRSRRQELRPALGPRRGRQQCRLSSRTRPKEEAQSPGPDSFGIGGTQTKAVSVSPASYRRCCCPPGLLPTDRRCVNPVSSRKRVPAPTRLSGTRIYSSGTCASHLLPVVAPAAFTRSAMHQAGLERLELPQVDRLAAGLS
jgi:hypothetical protein